MTPLVWQYTSIYITCEFHHHVQNYEERRIYDGAGALGTTTLRAQKAMILLCSRAKREETEDSDFEGRIIDHFTSVKARKVHLWFKSCAY